MRFDFTTLDTKLNQAFNSLPPAAKILIKASPQDFVIGNLQKAEEFDRINSETHRTLEKQIQRLHADFFRETQPRQRVAFRTQLDDSEEAIEHEGDELIQDARNAGLQERLTQRIGRTYWSQLLNSISAGLEVTQNEVFFLLDSLLRFAFEISAPQPQGVTRLNPQYLEARSQLFQTLHNLVPKSDPESYEAMVGNHLDELRSETDFNNPTSIINYAKQYADFTSNYPAELYTLAGVEQGDKDAAWKYLQSL